MYAHLLMPSLTFVTPSSGFCVWLSGCLSDSGHGAGRIPSRIPLPATREHRAGSRSLMYSDYFGRLKLIPGAWKEWRN